MTELPTIIYVAGYGRSGSTLLDRSLAAVGGASVLSTGELAYLGRVFGGRCECGLALVSCPVWGKFSDLQASLDVVMAAESIRPSAKEVQERHIQTWREIGLALAGEGVTHVIDSSKTSIGHYQRPKLLRSAGFPVITVMPVRPFTGVMESRRARRARDGRRSFGLLDDLETLASWSFALLVGELDDPVVVPFGDLTEDPLSAASKCWELLGGCPSSGPGLAHMVAGNRLRVGEGGKRKTEGVVPSTAFPLRAIAARVERRLLERSTF